MSKIGRNALCPCGSGKKAKHCCGERVSRPHPFQAVSLSPLNGASAGEGGRGLPRLQNTDGDPLLFTEDHYTFAPRQRARVFERLMDMKGAQLDEEGVPSVIVFLKRGNPMHKDWEVTVVGRAYVDQAHLRLETNSVRRADALRTRVEAVCAELLCFQARQHRDANELLALL